MSTKLVLVGFLSQRHQGSLMQAVVGLTASLCFLLLHMVAQPFHQDGDDYLGTSTSFSVCVMMLAVVVLKVSVLREELSEFMTPELKDRYALARRLSPACCLRCLDHSRFPSNVVQIVEATRQERLAQEHEAMLRATGERSRGARPAVAPCQSCSSTVRAGRATGVRYQRPDNGI